MFTQRQRKILAILQKHQDGITSEGIARLVGVSSKTIRTDIKIMVSALKKDIAVINISTRKGYSLDIIDNAAFDTILNRKNKLYLDNDNRIKFIVHQLLENALNNKSTKQQDLADELYIGLSTLKANLKEVKLKLQKYNLDIVNYKNQGMRIKGNEAQIRYCISEYVFTDNTISNSININNFYRNLFAPYDLNTINKILINVISSYELTLTDTALKNLLVHVLIALKRACNENNVVYTLRESKEIEQHREFSIATSIFEEIYNKLRIDVATSEIYYLAQHLIASKKYADTNNLENKSNPYIEELVNAMLERINTIVGINFLQDKNLIKLLKIHLESVIPRIRFQMNIRNEILNVIKSEYPLAFQIGVIASKVIEEREQLAVNENEIGFIAIHFGAALTRMDIKTDHIKKRAIIVCGGGIGTAILLKARLHEYFKDLINVEKTLPGYRLSKEDLRHIDLIFTTIPLQTAPDIQKKLIYVKNLLNSEEIELVQQKFFHTSNISKTTIERFFCKDYFFTGKQFLTKEEILQFLTDKLESTGLIDTQTRNSVFEREVSSPTEIGNLVAIPHPMVNNSAVSSIAVMILNKPIMWVEHHVQVIFLISIAKNEFHFWEPIFLKLFKYLVKQNGIKKMIDNPNYQEFIKDFSREFNT